MVFPKFPILLNLPKFPPFTFALCSLLFHLSLITPIKKYGRARYFRNPRSVVTAISPEAKPRSKSPSKEGDLGGG